jgi:TctA family transporter
MKALKSTKHFYQYIYYRLFLYHKKQWMGGSSVAIINANFAISSSATALVYSIELLFERYLGTEFIFDNIYEIIVLTIIIVILQSILLSKDEKSLEEKYSKAIDSQLVWQIKGVLSLLFVYVPIISLLILMITG